MGRRQRVRSKTTHAIVYEDLCIVGAILEPELQRIASMLDTWFERSLALHALFQIARREAVSPRNPDEFRELLRGTVIGAVLASELGEIDVENSHSALATALEIDPSILLDDDGSTIVRRTVDAWLEIRSSRTGNTEFCDK